MHLYTFVLANISYPGRFKAHGGFLWTVGKQEPISQKVLELPSARVSMETKFIPA